MRVPGNSTMPTIRALQNAMEKAAVSKDPSAASRDKKPVAQDPNVHISDQARAKQRLSDVIGGQVATPGQRERTSARSAEPASKQAQKSTAAMDAGKKADAAPSEKAATPEKAAKRKPLTLESLRLERVQAALKALGVSSLSRLWDNLFSGSRFRR